MPQNRPRPRRAPLVLALAACLLVLTAAPSPAESTGVTATSAARSDPAALAALQRAKLALHPPLTLGTAPTLAASHPTLALRDLALLLPQLRGSDRREGRKLLERPQPGAGSAEPLFAREAGESPVCDPTFCLHWSDWGRDAPASPRFVDSVLGALRRSIAVENGELGWRGAKPDGRRGSKGEVGADGQVDVYIMELGRSLYGYAAPDPGQRGVRRFGYLVLDNDYAGFRGSPLQAMQATVAHEYNHILQFGYDSFQDLWLFEATAVWMEEKVYPALDDYIGYLRQFASSTQVPMTGEGMKIYGLGVWNHWLARRHGDELIRRVWELSPESGHFAVGAYGRALTQADGSSFSREFAGFAAAGAEWSAAQAFPDAARYPSIVRRRTLRRAGQGGRIHLDNTAYALIDVNTRRRNLKLAVRTRRGVQGAVALVGRDGTVSGGAVKKSVKYLPRGGRGTVRLSGARRFDRITAVIVNADGRSAGWGRGGQRLYRSDGSRFRYRLVR